MCWNCDWMGPKHHDLSMALCLYSHTSSVCESLTVSWLKTVTSAIILVSSSFGMTIVLQSQLERKATTKNNYVQKTNSRSLAVAFCPQQDSSLRRNKLQNGPELARMQSQMQECRPIVLFNVIEKKNAVNFTEQSKEPHLQKKNPRCGRRSL